MTHTESDHSDSGAEPPLSLEVPVPNGGRIATSFVSATVVAVSLVFPPNRLAELVAFYAALDGWSRSEEESSGATTHFHLEASSVTIGPCIDVESNGLRLDAVCVSIMQRR